MPFNGSGVFTRTMSWVSDATAGIKIRADRHDNEDDNLAGGLSNAICRDGQSTITANIGFSGKRIINLGNPVADQDAVTLYTLTKTPLTIAGNDAQGKLTFSGTESDPTAGLPLGLSFMQADLFFGVRKATSPPGIDGSQKHRFIWNDSSTGNGTTIARLDETGNFDVAQIGGVAGSTGSGLILYAGATCVQADAPKAPIIALRGGGAGAGNANVIHIYTGGASGGTAAQGICATFDSDKTLKVVGTITSSAYVQAATYFVSTTVNAVLASALAGAVYLRPNGPLSATGEFRVDSAGTIWAGGNVVATGGAFRSASGSVVLSGTNDVYLRPQGESSAAGQCVLTADGTFRSSGVIVGGTGLMAIGGETRTYANTNQDAYYTFYYTGGGAQMAYLSYAGASGTLVFQHTVGANGWLQHINNGNLSISGSVASKPGGGSWANSSDSRIKNVTGPYDHGLAQVLALHPVRYTYRGNDTLEPAVGSAPYDNSPNRQPAIDQTSFVGFVAQDIEATMPGMVKQIDGYIDGQHVTDLRTVDVSNLSYALVNAIHELNARIETLEAA